MTSTDIRVGFYAMLAFVGGVLVIRFVKEIRTAAG